MALTTEHRRKRWTNKYMYQNPSGSIRKSQSALWNPYIYIYSALTRSCFGRGVDHSSTHSASQSGHFRTGPILRVHSHSASQSGHFRPRANSESEIDESLQSFCQSKWPFLDAVHFRALPTHSASQSGHFWTRSISERCARPAWPERAVSEVQSEPKGRDVVLGSAPGVG